MADQYNPTLLGGNRPPRKNNPLDERTSSFDAVAKHLIEVSRKPGGARVVAAVLLKLAKSPNAGAAKAYQDRLEAAERSFTPKSP